MSNDMASDSTSATSANDKAAKDGIHPPPEPLLFEAQEALQKRHFPHAKKLLFSEALRALIRFLKETKESAKSQRNIAAAEFILAAIFLAVVLK